MDGVIISIPVSKREQVHFVECRDRSLDITPARHHCWATPTGPQLELPASSTLSWQLHAPSRWSPCPR